jgi:MinD-like ATPase involved in chromosome partitioning or flagellar assembly
MLAAHRGDQVIALDANPDAGTLADRILGRSTDTTVRDLLNDLDDVHDATDLARYTGLAGRLHVLASEHDPAMSEAFSRQDCEQTIALLRRFFHVVVIDSGTGVTHKAIGAALDAAQSVVVVGAPTVDGASRASMTMDWLGAHGYITLAAEAVVALPMDRSSDAVDPAAVYGHFATRCRAVIPIPQDPHLATGGLVDLEQLRPATYDAALALTAAVADQFHGAR